MDTWSFREGNWRRGDDPQAQYRWFDICGIEDGNEDLVKLASRFDLHPLAVEDCLSPLMHAPKVDDFGTYLFIVLQALQGDAREPRFEELDIFLGQDFLITYRDQPIPEVDNVARILEQGSRVRPGTDGLLYEVADRVVDSILPGINAVADLLDEIEDAALRDPGREVQARAIVQVRASAGRLRRTLMPQLALMQRLSRGEFDAIAEPNRIYFRDVYDHMVRIDLALEGVREDAEMVLSTYLSALNNRLSEVMKVLSVVAALALPATVISGIFGTNFDNVPGLHSNWGFGLMIAAMAAVAFAMWMYFWRRGWF